jgi:hypothetical protein
MSPGISSPYTFIREAKSEGRFERNKFHINRRHKGSI